MIFTYSGIMERNSRDQLTVYDPNLKCRETSGSFDDSIIPLNDSDIVAGNYITVEANGKAVKLWVNVYNPDKITFTQSEIDKIVADIPKYDPVKKRIEVIRKKLLINPNESDQEFADRVSKDECIIPTERRCTMTFEREVKIKTAAKTELKKALGLAIKLYSRVLQTHYGTQINHVQLKERLLKIIADIRNQTTLPERDVLFFEFFSKLGEPYSTIIKNSQSERPWVKLFQELLNDKEWYPFLFDSSSKVIQDAKENLIYLFNLILHRLAFFLDQLPLQISFIELKNSQETLGTFKLGCKAESIVKEVIPVVSALSEIEQESILRLANISFNPSDKTMWYRFFETILRSRDFDHFYDQALIQFYDSAYLALEPIIQIVIKEYRKLRKTLVIKDDPLELQDELMNTFVKAYEENVEYQSIVKKHVDALTKFLQRAGYKALLNEFLFRDIICCQSSYYMIITETIRRIQSEDKRQTEEKEQKEVKARSEAKRQAEEKEMEAKIRKLKVDVTLPEDIKIDTSGYL